MTEDGAISRRLGDVLKQPNDAVFDFHVNSILQIDDQNVGDRYGRFYEINGVLFFIGHDHQSHAM